MKENSIKEDIEILEKNIKSVKENADMAFFESDEDYCFFKAVEHILSAYKKILKENEELLQEKINNQKIIALAQNNMLNYQAGFEDGKNGRTSAVQSIIENQQYYIFQKQIEKYERHIEKLQKENEELKYKYNKALSDVIAGVDLDNTYISKQKVKDKISERQFELQQEYKDFEDDSILIVLQELLEGRK